MNTINSKVFSNSDKDSIYFYLHAKQNTQHIEEKK